MNKANKLRPIAPKTIVTLDYTENKKSTKLLTNTFEDGMEMVSHLFDCWLRTPQQNKEDNTLISPAHFIHSDLVKTTRGNANVEYMSAIMLDFDNKKHPQTFFPKDFGLLFPDLLYVATNTYSQDCFRIIIPSKHKFTAQQYVAVWNHIYLTIVNVYNQSGIDLSKRAPSSLFFAPCRVKGSASNFFDPYDGEMFNPYDWLDKPLLEFPKRTYVEYESTSDTDTVKELVELLHSYKHNLNFEEWRQVAFSVASAVGVDTAKSIMNDVFGEVKTGETEKLFTSYNKENSPKIATLVYLCKQLDEKQTLNILRRKN